MWILQKCRDKAFDTKSNEYKKKITEKVQHVLHDLIADETPKG